MKLIWKAHICMAKIELLDISLLKLWNCSCHELYTCIWIVLLFMAQTTCKRLYTDTHHSKRTNGVPWNCMKVQEFSHFSFSYVEYSRHTCLFYDKGQLQTWFFNPCHNGKPINLLSKGKMQLSYKHCCTGKWWTLKDQTSVPVSHNSFVENSLQILDLLIGFLNNRCEKCIFGSFLLYYFSIYTEKSMWWHILQRICKWLNKYNGCSLICGSIQLWYWLKTFMFQILINMIHY